MKKIKTLSSFLKEGFLTDIKFLRTRLALFFFNVIPDLYLLMPLRNMFLKLGGASLPLFGCYIRSPFSCGNLSNLKLSTGTFINKNAYIEANGLVQIGTSCQIGPFLKIENTNHIPDQNMRAEIFPVFVENDVWIGSGVTLLPRSHVKEKSIVAAGAVVVGQIGPQGLFGGVPAKKLNQRNS